VSSFNLLGWANQYFTAAGALGAFSFGSYLDFSPMGPQTGTFNMWLTGAKVSIAGATLYGFFDLTDCGSGWLFGATGTAGDVKMRAEAYFNLAYSLIAGSYTFDDVVGGFADFAYAYDPLHGCTAITTTVAQDAFELQTCSYCFCWSGVDIQLDFPFACIDDVQVNLSFDTSGFAYVKFGLNDIALGVPWLTIDDFDIKFTTAAKTVTVDLDVNITATCLTPYFIINPSTAAGSSGFSITSLELYALGLTQKFNGLTFKSITLLDSVNFGLTWSGSPLPIAYFPVYACGPAYEELFEISYDADACCGGAFSFDVKNWFDISPAATPSLFGWAMTEVSVSVGVGSNFTISAAGGVSTAGWQYVQGGFGVTF